MRYPWWLNLCKSLALFLVIVLAMGIFIQPTVVQNLLSDETLRAGIDNPVFNSAEYSAEDREALMKKTNGQILAVAYHGMAAAVGAALCWLVFASVADAFLVWRPGAARRYFWFWVAFSIVTLAVVWLLDADGFLVAMIGRPPFRLPEVISGDLGSYLMFVTTAMAFLEYWLLCIVVTPPTMQRAVPAAQFVCRPLMPMWRTGARTLGGP